jgi:predicted nucleotidyltransferase component of viral defense system
MDFDEIRRLTITALFSDDVLFDQLVLKGGNAITLVHGLGNRASFDLDFSLTTDFPDLDDARRRSLSALERRFASADYVVFDHKLVPKPALRGPDERPWWGGYELSFKIISSTAHRRLSSRPSKMPIEAQPVGPNQERTLRVDISKNEFTEGRIELDLDHYTIRVYTPAMVAAEKLRAICQQMPEYTLRAHARARARDFYDIHLAVSRAGVDLGTLASAELVRAMFDAKQVPIALLGTIATQREFHRPDWPDVVSAVGPGELKDFDFYFDFVVDEVSRLKTRWDV